MRRRPGLALLVILLAATGCSEPKAVAPPPPPPQPAFHLTPGAAALIIDRKVSLGLTDPFWFRLSLQASLGKDLAPYQFDLVTTGPRAEDYEFVSGGIRCLVPRPQVEMVRNTLVDASVEDGVRGFQIINPRVGDGTPVWVTSPEP